MSSAVIDDPRIVALNRLRRWEAIQLRRKNANYEKLPPLHYVAAMEEYRLLQRQREFERQRRHEEDMATTSSVPSLVCC